MTSLWLVIDSGLYTVAEGKESDDYNGNARISVRIIFQVIQNHVLSSFDRRGALCSDCRHFEPSSSCLSLAHWPQQPLTTQQLQEDIVRLPCQSSTYETECRSCLFVQQHYS